MTGGERASGRGGALVGIAAVLMALCCIAGPAILGAVAGAAIGGVLGIGTAVLVAAAVAVLLYRRRGSKVDGC